MKNFIWVIVAMLILSVVGSTIGCTPKEAVTAAEYNDRGNVLFNEGKYDEAIAEYNKAIELYPEYSSAWNNKGVALEKLGRNEEALECYNKALQLDPSYELAKSNKDRLIARGVTTPGTPTDKIKSIYDGTYTGTFYYQYPADPHVAYKDLRWIRASFTLTITLETIDINNNNGQVYLVITNIDGSGPSFGTGIPANTSEPGGSRANLPIDPSTMLMKSTTYGFKVCFTNCDLLFVGLTDGDLFVSSDGRTLSNSPSSTGTAVKSGPWYPTPWPPSGPFSLENFGAAGARSESWSLTKVSP